MSKMKSALTGCLVLAIGYLVASATPIAGAELVNIVIRNSTAELLIDIKLKDVFTEDLKAALSNFIY